MELKVTRIEPAAAGDKFGLPTVHFEGTSRSMHTNYDPNGNSKIKGRLAPCVCIESELILTAIGTVRMTDEGEVRWTTYSIYNGSVLYLCTCDYPLGKCADAGYREERWKSEGIQVGGVRSARGILGNWFDKYVSSNTFSFPLFPLICFIMRYCGIMLNNP